MDMDQALQGRLASHYHPAFLVEKLQKIFQNRLEGLHVWPGQHGFELLPLRPLFQCKECLVVCWICFLHHPEMNTLIKKIGIFSHSLDELDELILTVTVAWILLVMLVLR